MTLPDSKVERARFFSRDEAKSLLGVSEATFHKYVSILRDCWPENFRYIPRQTRWSVYQLHCLQYVRDLFHTGRNEYEVVDYITQFKIPDLSVDTLIPDYSSTGETN